MPAPAVQAGAVLRGVASLRRGVLPWNQSGATAPGQIPAYGEAGRGNQRRTTPPTYLTQETTMPACISTGQPCRASVKHTA